MALHKDDMYNQFSPDPTESQLDLIARMEDEALAGPSNEPQVIPETPPHLQGIEDVENTRGNAFIVANPPADMAEEQPMDISDEDDDIAEPPRVPPQEERRRVTYSCPDCDKTFTRRFTLNRHKRRIHMQGAPNRPAPNTFRCRQCDKFFSRRDSLRRHQHVHARQAPRRNEQAPNPPPPAVADVPPDQHVPAPPPPPPRFACQTCGKTFSRRDNMMRHFRRAHRPA
ncbi:zinc finger protein 526-like [Patiria miniata]|uniref:C2H2-type domain-containing protein n=1 Tax=Patiria miniata TaxID=46514 RepID=A0A914AVA2_PATMI|nr:zinc finger protein 526-like [Patiria miniata]